MFVVFFRRRIIFDEWISDYFCSVRMAEWLNSIFIIFTKVIAWTLSCCVKRASLSQRWLDGLARSVCAAVQTLKIVRTSAHSVSTRQLHRWWSTVQFGVVLYFRSHTPRWQWICVKTHFLFALICFRYGKRGMFFGTAWVGGIVKKYCNAMEASEKSMSSTRRTKMMISHYVNFNVTNVASRIKCWLEYNARLYCIGFGNVCWWDWLHRLVCISLSCTQTHRCGACKNASMGRWHSIRRCMSFHELPPLCVRVAGGASSAVCAKRFVSLARPSFMVCAYFFAWLIRLSTVTAILCSYFRCSHSISCQFFFILAEICFCLSVWKRLNGSRHEVFFLLVKLWWFRLKNYQLITIPSILHFAGISLLLTVKTFQIHGIFRGFSARMPCIASRLSMENEFGSGGPGFISNTQTLEQYTSECLFSHHCSVAITAIVYKYAAL